MRLRSFFDCHKCVFDTGLPKDKELDENQKYKLEKYLKQVLHIRYRYDTVMIVRSISNIYD